jgi:hypothetical protein
MYLLPSCLMALFQYRDSIESAGGMTGVLEMAGKQAIVACRSTVRALSCS